MQIPHEVARLRREGVGLDEAIERLSRYGKRNVRNWYRALEDGTALRMPDYRVIAHACGMRVIETPSMNRKSAEVRDEALGEYALSSRQYSDKSCSHE
jgi:hypothetical protein